MHFFGQHKCFKRCFQAAFAHIGCLIGCERNIGDGEIPLVIADSSSLSAEFHVQIVPCPGVGHGSQRNICLLVLQLDPYLSTDGACGSVIALLIVICTGSRSITTTTKPSLLKQ